MAKTSQPTQLRSAPTADQVVGGASTSDTALAPVEVRPLLTSPVPSMTFEEARAQTEATIRAAFEIEDPQALLDETVVEVTGTCRSRQFGRIAAALCLAQLEIGSAPKNQTADAQKYSYDYSDMASVREVSRMALARHGIAVVQYTFTGPNTAIVTTELLHVSGQFIRLEVGYPFKGDIQGLGSVFTYLRRYGYQAILAIAPAKDDDGQVAKQQEREREQDRRQRQTENRSRNSFDGDDLSADIPGVATSKQVADFQTTFWNMAKAVFSTEADAKSWLAAEEPNPRKASVEQLRAVIGRLQQKLKAQRHQADQAAAAGADFTDTPEEAKRRGGVQQRLALTVRNKGLNEDAFAWWAADMFDFRFDAEKGRPSSRATPLSQVETALRELAKLTDDDVAKLTDDHARHLEDLRQEELDVQQTAAPAADQQHASAAEVQS